MMEYKGYIARVEFDSEADIFHGQVLHTRDVITFQGESVEELRREFQESVEDYLEFCAERGEEPERPFSGRFVVRMGSDLHRDIAICAARANVSINRWVVQQLQECSTRTLVPQRELGMGEPMTDVWGIYTQQFMGRVPAVVRLGDVTGLERHFWPSVYSWFKKEEESILTDSLSGSPGPVVIAAASEGDENVR